MTQATERQMELLSKEDSRFNAVGPGGTGLIMRATTEVVGSRIVSFGLPSAPALYLYLSRKFFEARQASDINGFFDDHPQGIWPDSHTKLFDYLENAIAEITFAFTALEAFANESVPKGFKYKWKSAKKEREQELEKADIERHVSLDEKLKKVLPLAHDIKSPSGTKPWQDYKKLKAIRDRLIHLKSVDVKASGPEDSTLR